MSRRAPQVRALATAFLLSSVPATLLAQSPLTVASPDGKTQVTVEVRGGALRYGVRHNDGSNCSFFDGHAKWFKGSALLWDPNANPTCSSQCG